jgi:HAD superfamily hydrolase (TIGR01509 family)
VTRGVLFDVDGTLVDSNYLHVVAWSDAFRDNDHQVPMSLIHSLIGQGAERLVEDAIGKADEAVVAGHTDHYRARLGDLQAFDGAAELLRRVKQTGRTVVLATSASREEAEHLCTAIDAADAVDHVTTGDDVEESKPAPDIVAAALDAAGLAAGDCVFVGDSRWDVEAAARAGMPCVCVRTGGIADEVLRSAGAIAIFDSVAALLADFDSSPLADA